MKYTRRTIQKHRKAWLEELRSGNREQAEGMLCELDEGEVVGFCCLGVATDMARVKAVGIDHDDYYSKTRRTYENEGDVYEYLMLPQKAQDWLGVTAGDPRLGFDIQSEADWERLEGLVSSDAFLNLTEAADGWECFTPAQLNDAGLTFVTIAAVIEAFGFHPMHDQLAAA